MLADQDDREPGAAAGGVAKPFDLAGDPLAKRSGCGLSVDQLGGNQP